MKSCHCLLTDPIQPYELKSKIYVYIKYVYEIQYFRDTVYCCSSKMIVCHSASFGNELFGVQENSFRQYYSHLIISLISYCFRNQLTPSLFTSFIDSRCKLVSFVRCSQSASCSECFMMKAKLISFYNCFFFCFSIFFIIRYCISKVAFLVSDICKRH